MNEERTIKYVGGGASLPGVPARNLTPDEYEMHKDFIESCSQSLYLAPDAEEAKATKKPRKAGKE